MERDIFFIEAILEDLPKEPPWALVLAANDVLRQAGYSLSTAREGSYIFDKIKEGIREKGIIHYTNTISLMEGVLPDNIPREDLVDLLRYMVRNIQASNELLIIDPYLFPDNPDADYITYLGKIFGSAIGKITRLDVVTSPKCNHATEAAFFAMVQAIKPGVAHGIKYTTSFHDRFWIGDKIRGVFVGTSLNGIGKRYAIADYIREEDVKDIYARFAALP